MSNLLSRVESIITAKWAKLVAWQDARGYRWSSFDAEDTVQRASLNFYRFAVAGKYDGKTDAELERIFVALVRQAGSHLWSAVKH